MAVRKKTQSGQSREPVDLPEMAVLPEFPPDDAAEAEPDIPADADLPVDAEPGTPDPAQPDAPGSEEVQVVLSAADEPVRRGGWILTGNGWEPEDAVAAEAAAEKEE